MPGVTETGARKEGAGLVIIQTPRVLRQHLAQHPRQSATWAVRSVEKDALQRLLREDANRHVVRGQAGEAQAFFYGVYRKTAVVLAAREAFLLVGRDKLTIDK